MAEKKEQNFAPRKQHWNSSHHFGAIYHIHRQVAARQTFMSLTGSE